MTEQTFHIDGERFDDFPGFIAEFNRGFVSHVGGQWNGNMDAFNDYLYWGDQGSTIRWMHSNKSRDDLGHDAMAQWLAENLLRCHPANRSSVQARLDQARNGLGPTLFEWLVEIIDENSEFVDLVLE
ncbi:hypothetical protein [Bremerella sp.]|uniref:hypothetical protein n=1 Tax=Bremerella sp. TaxID=2795602 RepID=UPI0039189462